MTSGGPEGETHTQGEIRASQRSGVAGVAALRPLAPLHDLHAHDREHVERTAACPEAPLPYPPGSVTERLLRVPVPVPLRMQNVHRGAGAPWVTYGHREGQSTAWPAGHLRGRSLIATFLLRFQGSMAVLYLLVSPRQIQTCFPPTV